MDAVPKLSIRRRAAAAALAAATALFAASPGTAAAQDSDPPAHIPVTASLDGCDARGSAPICRIVVSFDAVARATSYQTAITAPDGAQLIDAAAEPEPTTYSVKYRGNGTYVVRVTAYGAAAVEQKTSR